jgi:hypothetical protein
MCGYCTEAIAIRALQPRENIGSPSSFLGLYLEEVRDFPGALRQLSLEVVSRPYIASITMYRAIEMLVAHGFESESYQALIQQPQLISAISVACAKGAETALSDLDARLDASDFAWLFETDTYLKAGYFERHSNESIDPICYSLLNEYVGWWLDGGSVQHQDLNQRMQDTGIMDPIEDIPMAEQLLFSHRFPALWFSLLRISSLPMRTKMLWTIITKNPSGVPDFDGLDLWLQRRATLAYYDQQGLAPFLNEFESIREGLIQYLAAARITKSDEKSALIAAIGENNSLYSPTDEWLWVDDLQS